MPISWREPCWRAGLSREGVVAVVTERNLDWIAAMLAIFKAGGAYLPIEPHFPADRIARTLSRAGCRLVLTERGSTTMLDQAIDSLSGVQTLFIDALYEEAHSGGDPGVAVAPDQLAYIYFTSGSTGEPKGAMVRARRDAQPSLRQDRRSQDRRGDVVAQTAPQCFDISLWQLVSALLVGGRTLLVEQEAVLTRGVSSAKSSTAGSTSFRSCRPTWKSSSPIWRSTPASCRTCGACRSQARR